MEIQFATSDMEAAAMCETALARIYGGSGRKACQRLLELAAMENLAVAASLPTHRLTAQPQARGFSINVSGTQLILFEAILKSGANTSSRELDLSSITAIRILAWAKHDN
jgi:hypothetical protein